MQFLYASEYQNLIYLITFMATYVSDRKRVTADYFIRTDGVSALIKGILHSIKDFHSAQKHPIKTSGKSKKRIVS
jgi:hypothetical protein